VVVDFGLGASKTGHPLRPHLQVLACSRMYISEKQNGIQFRYEEACSSAGGGRNTDKSIDGKYTSSVKGHTEFGWWSRKGIKRFNALCELMEADRISEMAAAVEAASCGKYAERLCICMKYIYMSSACWVCVCDSECRSQSKVFPNRF
jgi:hypothetical protein